MGWVVLVSHLLPFSSLEIYVEIFQAFAAHWLCQVSCCELDCAVGLLSEGITLWLALRLTSRMVV